MADITARLWAAIEQIKAFISMRLSGRITQHLFDPITLVGGIAVVVLVVVLLVLGFSGTEETRQQHQRGTELAPVAQKAMARAPLFADDDPT